MSEENEASQVGLEQPATEPKKKKVWGLMKAASILTKENGKKRKIAIGQTREMLSDLIKHDVALVKAGGTAEILKALIEEMVKKLAKTNHKLDL